MGAHSLTAEQAAHFRREGFVVIPGALDAAALREADAAFQAIVAEQTPLGDAADKLEWEPERAGETRAVRRIYHPVHQHPSFEAIALSDAVLDPVEAVLGPHLQFHHSKLNVKPAQVGSVVEWHQDFAYFPHTNTDLVACLIYLDDASRENGCLQVIPRQHTATEVFDHAGEKGLFAGKITDPDFRAGLPEPVACEGPAGTMILMHCMTPHASHPNRSGRSRRTLICEYRAADAYPIYANHFTHEFEAYTRQVRGQRSTRARFNLSAFPMPQFDGPYVSLYDLQERHRAAAAEASRERRAG